MKKLTVLLIISVLWLMPGCGGNNDEEPAADSSQSAESRETIDATGDAPTSYESMDSASRNAGLPPLGKIETVTVKTVSSYPQDGFKAVVDMDGADGNPADYRFEWKVDGETVSGVTGDTLKWQEGFKKGDTVMVTVTPFNEFGEGVLTASGEFTIPDSPPVITSEPKPGFDDGNFTYTVEAYDPDGGDLSYTLKNAPRGMTIEPATGVISWQYGEEDAGEHVIVIEVSDSDGAVTSQQLTLSINTDSDKP